MIIEGVTQESRLIRMWKELEEQRSGGYSQRIKETATLYFSLRHWSGWTAEPGDL